MSRCHYEITLIVGEQGGTEIVKLKSQLLITTWDGLNYIRQYDTHNLCVGPAYLSITG